MHLIECGQIRDGDEHLGHLIDLCVLVPRLLIDANVIGRRIDRIERALLEQVSEISRYLVTGTRS